MKNGPMFSKHVAHDHLLSVLRTHLKECDLEDVKILDVGCGNGDLIIFLHRKLNEYFPYKNIDIYGFDVCEHGAKCDLYINKVVAKLEKQIPQYNWSNKISSISDKDKWPYSDNFFDIIISNQVVEHVNDHIFFFHENVRSLRENGLSVHLFPVKNVLIEVHLKVPFVHWITEYELLRRYIKAFVRLGAVRHFSDLKNSQNSVDKLSEIYSDYLINYTNYVDSKELLRIGKMYNLRTSFKYTKNLYIQKIKSLIGMRAHHDYNDGVFFIDKLLFHFLKYISCVTLVLEKKNTRVPTGSGF